MVARGLRHAEVLFLTSFGSALKLAHTRDVPNIALVLKAEVARVARTEVRRETMQLKKAVSSYRPEIAALKRRTQELESQLRRLRSTSHSKLQKGPPESDPRIEASAPSRSRPIERRDIRIWLCFRLQPCLAFILA
jgi:hypothetical protein